MSEADYEYLLRALSEARSRATEIAIAVRGHVGVEHRLSELGNSAVSQIESVLRETRRVASEKSEAVSSGEGRPAGEAARRTSLAPSAQAPDLASEHWFPAFANELLERYRTAGGITFEIVERVLQERKEVFLRDLEIARRMYRAYPHLFQGTAMPQR